MTAEKNRMEVFDDLKTKPVSKGAILLHQGDVCKVFFKVIKGCLKSYVVNKTGKEHIIQFAPEGWVISYMDSYFNNTKANIFIEDSEIILFSKAAFAEILKHFIKLRW